jgi:hypothetical protein
MWPFTVGRSPYAGSVMAHIREYLIELLLWTVMGRVRALEHMLLGVLKLLRALLSSGNECSRPRGCGAGHVYLESGSP